MKFSVISVELFTCYWRTAFKSNSNRKWQGKSMKLISFMLLLHFYTTLWQRVASLLLAHF